MQLYAAAFIDADVAESQSCSFTEPQTTVGEHAHKATQSLRCAGNESIHFHTGNKDRFDTVVLVSCFGRRDSVCDVAHDDTIAHGRVE